MTAPLSDETMLLSQDIPELELHRGDVGAISDVWPNPRPDFDVEFQKLNPESRMRAQLMMNQIARILEEYSPFTRGGGL